MAHEARKSLTCERLLICEGPTDEAFFKNLIQRRNLPDFCIRIPADASRKLGVDGFPELLEAIPAWDGVAALRHLIVVADNDADASASFRKVKDFLRNARPDTDPPFTYGIPDRAMVRAPGTPATTTIMMMPKRGNRGCLETLLLTAAEKASASAQRATACVDTFVTCAGVDAWSSSKQAKMRLHSLIAATYKKNPALSLSQVWTQAPDLIPLNDPCFDPIADFLRRF
ncbi:MAG: DUF3226 domain-containing protein [Caulobacterales bacterium]